MHASYTSMEYLCRPDGGKAYVNPDDQDAREMHQHSRLKVKYSVRCLHSWFPRSRYSRLG